VRSDCDFWGRCEPIHDPVNYIVKLLVEYCSVMIFCAACLGIFCKCVVLEWWEEQKRKFAEYKKERDRRYEEFKKEEERQAEERRRQADERRRERKRQEEAEEEERRRQEEERRKQEEAEFEPALLEIIKGLDLEARNEPTRATPRLLQRLIKKRITNMEVLGDTSGGITPAWLEKNIGLSRADATNLKEKAKHINRERKKAARAGHGPAVAGQQHAPARGRGGGGGGSSGGTGDDRQQARGSQGGTSSAAVSPLSAWTADAVEAVTRQCGQNTGAAPRFAAAADAVRRPVLSAGTGM